MKSKVSGFYSVFMLAAVLAAGCSGETGTAGIDGTGAPAVFAFGRVTAFGSVIVNGIRYDTSDAAFVINGSPGSQADLDVGDIVFVAGRLDPDATGGAAETITFDHVLEGPIASIDETDESFAALGQTVIVGPDTSFDDTISHGGAASLSVGDVINVSGFRRADGAIAATRVGKQGLGAGEFKTTGAVTSVASDGKRFNINSLVVDYSAAVLLGREAGTAIARGDVVEIKGSLTATDALTATSVQFKGEVLGTAGDQADIEGYVTAFDASDPESFEIAGLPVSVTSETAFEGSLNLEAPVEVKGTLSSTGVLVASDVKTGFSPQLGGYTVDGLVFDAYTGVVAEADINLFVETGRSGYSYWWAHGPLVSDESGRFSAPFLPESRITIWATKEGFVQPCAVIIDLHDNVALNVEVTSESTLSSPNPPRPQSVQGTSLSGMVYEATDAGNQPVAGAKLWVGHGVLREIWAATTISDPQGGYFLCNLPPVFDLWATMPGFADTVISVMDLTEPNVLDIEMKRQ